jgi:hypothetical protein
MRHVSMMHPARAPWVAVLAVLFVTGAFRAAPAQDRFTATASLPAASGSGPFRELAPGVEIAIPPDRHEEETFSTHDIVEILHGIPGLEWKPQFSPETQTLRQMATSTVFRRDIWCLEFTFKPVRMMWVDVPQSDGRMERKLIWYMIYHVRNLGEHLSPTKQDDKTHALSNIDRDMRFFPTFVLESHEYNKSYLDRVIPVAIQAVQQKEDPNRTLLNTVDIGSKKIPVSHGLIDRSVWGVATWEDVDPRIDSFSVSVAGLTNAYQWEDPPGAFKAGDPPTAGRQLRQKTLVLNFWRPGDQYREDKRQIRFGIPGQVDYRWVYR